jgi:glycine/D-amino acid oxidase-like deaminating enzyme/nitrite reductase/ring-hydroxylating ferredoxin subunit
LLFNSIKNSLMNSQDTNPEFTSGSHLSYWTDSVKPIEFEKLKKNLVTDVVIIGGGIAGLSVAYNLCMQGKKVVLVEDGFMGSGETGRTTAHLVTALDDRYYELERIYGEDNVKLIAQSHAQAINFVEQTVQKENIDCDFTRLDGYLFLHPNDEPESLDKEFEAAKKAGLSVEKVSAMPGIDDSSPAILFREQATFHPLKYLQGLCNAIIQKGGLLFTKTHAKEIDENGIVSEDGFKVSANFIVVATNSPVNNKTRMHLKQYAYRTYVIGAMVRKGTLPNVLWWDTGDSEENENIPPYHYVRLQPYNELYDLLICGGEDHPTGEPNPIVEENRYSRLVTWARRRFNFSEIIYRWSGQVLEPMDGLAFIGHNPMSKDNIYIATGDSGNGMTHGTIAGMLLTDMILGKENPWEKIYNPSRFKLLKAGGTFFKEIGSMLVEYYRTKPRGEGAPLSSLQPGGKGEIVELDGDKYGAYVDDSNKLHLVGAECMHLGCIVKWNNDEKTWDCPCHGSRYTSEGKVINGPANKDLPHYVQPDRKISKVSHEIKHVL